MAKKKAKKAAVVESSLPVPMPEVLTVPIDEIVPRYTRENNPNKMEDEKFELLTAVIKEEGFLQPILVTPMATGQWQIEDGHHRWWAAQAAGLTSISVVVKNEHTTRAILLGIGMNRLRGELDLTTTADVIREAQATLDLQMSEVTMLTGFSEAELATLLETTNDHANILDENAQGPDDDESEKDASVTFTLEVIFTNREDYKKAKKSLRKIGKGDMSAGLLALLGESKSKPQADVDVTVEDDDG